MPIQVLAPEVASQIAAGEVVERPASVVKELLENALDAGANQISISVAGAGQRLIEVADDGQGILAQELPIAVARHATSKLRTAQDLFHIVTLGFRGEALASIGSVSRFTVTSRTPDAPLGMRMRVEGGMLGKVEPVGAPIGTVVRVEDLFYNVPARLKFLKQDSTERRQIDGLVTRYALAYPKVHFQLQQEGKVGLQTSGNGDHREVLAALYGVDVARQMIEVIYQDELLKVRGFISAINLTRANRREISFFVNGRPVQDASLGAAVMQAYHTLLMVGRFPLTALFLELPPEEIDVNVHPTKAEVRFRDSSRVFSSLQRAVRKSLLAHTPVPEVGGVTLRWTDSSPGSVSPPAPPWGWRELPPDTGAPGPFFNPESAGLAAQPSHSLQPGLPGQRHAPILRLVGQIAASYLVAEGPDGLYLIDQHAAHERVLFERLLAQQAASQESGLPRQTLLNPATVHLPPAHARLLSAKLPVLAKLGFDVELFGPAAFIVRALPAILSHMDPAAALRVVVEDFEEDETPLQAEIEHKIAARVCKRAAVKAGQVLSPDEQRSLLSDLENCVSPRTCPHGRPTMIHLSVDLLERQFGRKGPR
jgi:DNA mismatch repair protein MutL